MTSIVGELKSQNKGRSQAHTRGGGSRGSDAPPPTSNYYVPPAPRFHKYKLRFLYFRMQKLTPYSIKFIKKNSGRACPPDPSRWTLRRWRTSPPPPPLGQPWVRACIMLSQWRVLPSKSNLTPLCDDHQWMVWVMVYTSSRPVQYSVSMR